MRREERRTVLQLETMEGRALLSGGTSVLNFHPGQLGAALALRQSAQRDLHDDAHDDVMRNKMHFNAALARAVPFDSSSLFDLSSKFTVGAIGTNNGTPTTEAKLLPGPGDQEFNKLGIKLTMTLTTKLPFKQDGEFLDLKFQRIDGKPLSTTGAFEIGPVLNIKFSQKVEVKRSFFYFATGGVSPSGLEKKFASLTVDTGLDPTALTREVYVRGLPQKDPLLQWSPLSGEGLHLTGKKGEMKKGYPNGTYPGDFQKMGVPLTVNEFHIGIWIVKAPAKGK